MTKRQGLLLALVLASGSTLLTYLWYNGKGQTAEAAMKPPAASTQGPAPATLPAGERTTAAGFVVPRHERAVVITVDATRGAGALAQPSDHVDILVAATDAQQRHLAETIVQDVPVLGPASTEAAAAVAGAADGKRQIVVAVNPQDAQRLMAAQVHGSLVVTLRNPGDREYAYVRPVVNPAAPRPAPPAAPAAVTIKPAVAAQPAPPSAAPAPAPRPSQRIRRHAPRPSMVIAGVPPEPIQLLPPPSRPAPAVRQVAPLYAPAPSAAGQAPKAIEVVKGTSVQTVMVKE